MRHNGLVSLPEIAPRQSMVGVFVVWVVAAAAAVTIGAVAPPDWRAAWMAVGMGLVIVSPSPCSCGPDARRAFCSGWR